VGHEELPDEAAFRRAEPVHEHAARMQAPLEELDVAPGRPVAFQSDDAELREGGFSRRNLAERRRNRVIDRHPGLAEPAREPRRSVRCEVEGADRRAVEEGCEHARHRAAERGALEERQPILR
jgi:hypothetical protein